MDNKLIKPILRWAGGKQWLAHTIAPAIKKHCKRSYIEPFLGGGSMYFAVLPDSAIISDINADLVTAYLQIRDNCEDVYQRLAKLNVSEDEYYRIRAYKPRTDINKAVRFLYLNRTCFNGIYRTNNEGVFNVPYGGGRNTDSILANDVLPSISEALRQTKIKEADFEQIIIQAKRGDIIYCDPVYKVKEKSTRFIKYGKLVFSWDDQIRLKEAIESAVKKGVNIVVSNTCHESIRDLYSQYKPHILSRKSLIGNVKTRGVVNEYLFVLGDNDELKKDIYDACLSNQLMDKKEN